MSRWLTVILLVCSCTEHRGQKLAQDGHPTDDKIGKKVELITEYLCREATRTIVHFHSETHTIYGVDQWNRYEVNVYRIHLNKTVLFGNHTSEPYIPYVKISELSPNSTYIFGILVKINVSSAPIEIMTEHHFKTLSDDYINISTVAHSEVGSIVWYSYDDLRFNFTWEPVMEKVCTYEIVLRNYNATIGEHPQHLFTRDQDFYRVEIGKLRFKSHYYIAVYPSNLLSEGQKFEKLFRVPTCIELSRNSSLCIPPAPTGVTAMVEKCVLHVGWDEVVNHPPLYDIKIFKGTAVNEGPVYNTSVPGAYRQYAQYVTGVGDHMTVVISSWSRQGSSPETSLFIANNCRDGDHPHVDGITFTQPKFMDTSEPPLQVTPSTDNSSAYLLVITVVLVVIALILAGHAGYKVYLTHKSGPPLIQPEFEMRAPIVQPKTDSEDDSTGNTSVEDAGEYEVERTSLHLKEVVGEGEFGVVRRAYMIKGDEKKEVAVKMLRDKASAEDRKQLKLEMEVMKSVGVHDNIVCLVGFCSSNCMLVVEYCSLGDLQNYLRDIWSSKNSAEAVYKQNNQAGNNEGVENVVSNLLYDQTEAEKTRLNVTLFDLISIAKQVAMGMEYLSYNKVIHRDLAARNILLNSSSTVKISDFGLSRDVYEENMYRRKGGRRLPIKWMAIECLVHQMFTSQSDVWSFGILLWEIMTLGGCPYPSLQAEQVYKALQQGDRLEKPKLCPDNLYSLMFSCWDAIPHLRPTFSYIVQRLEEIMKSLEEPDYLELEEGMISYYLYGLPNAIETSANLKSQLRTREQLNLPKEHPNSA